MATSQISISTATSSLDSRKNILPGSDHHHHNGNNTENNRQGSFNTETSSQAGSLVSYNPSFSSPSGNATILEVSGEEPMNDIIATHPAPAQAEHVKEEEEKESDDEVVANNNIDGDESEEHDDDSASVVNYPRKWKCCSDRDLMFVRMQCKNFSCEEN